MKLSTIWSMPAMSYAEKFRQTFDLGAQKWASKLPKRVKYWAAVQQIAKTPKRDEVVPDIKLSDILSRLEGGPR